MKLIGELLRTRGSDMYARLELGALMVSGDQGFPQDITRGTLIHRKAFEELEIRAMNGEARMSHPIPLFTHFVYYYYLGGGDSSTIPIVILHI